MILTFLAAMNLLLSVCTLLLTIGIIRTVYRIFKRWDKSDEEEKHELEKGFYLTFAVVVVVLAIRLFLIPLYFWNMQTFVPLIPGAMCLWGVFDALPEATWGLLFLKLIIPVAYIGWLLLAKINSSCRTNPLIKNLMLFFLFLSPFLLIDFGVEVYVLSQLTPVQVLCCSSAIDVGTRLVPMAVGGFSGQSILLIMFFSYSLVYVGSMMLSEKHRTARLNTLFLTIPLAIVTIITITETLTPWLLELPFHHCPFCLFFLHPISLIFIILFWFGLSTPWLKLIIDKLGRSNNEAKNIENNLSNKLTSYGVYAMIFSLTILFVDVLMVFS